MTGSVYKTLSGIDLTDKLEKKGKFSYLSWADAIAVLLEYYPESTWETNLWDGLPYCQIDAGAFVSVSVTVEGIKRTQIHPVLDHRNKPIPLPDSFQVNTAIQRCLAKAIALHGLSLYVFRGEDLPVDGIKEHQDLMDAAEVRMLDHLANKDAEGLKEVQGEFSIDDFKVLWSRFSASQRKEMKDLVKG